MYKIAKMRLTFQSICGLPLCPSVFSILTFGTVPFTLFTFLRVISTGLGDDDFLVGFGVVQCTSNIHG